MPIPQSSVGTNVVSNNAESSSSRNTHSIHATTRSDNLLQRSGIMKHRHCNIQNIARSNNTNTTNSDCPQDQKALSFVLALQYNNNNNNNNNNNVVVVANTTTRTATTRKKERDDHQQQRRRRRRRQPSSSSSNFQLRQTKAKSFRPSVRCVDCERVSE